MKMRTLFFAVTTVAAAMGNAAAADLLMPPEVIEPPMMEPHTMSGWYLRGDIGASLKSNGTGEWDFWNQFVGVQGIDDTYRFDSLDIKTGIPVGIGVGYRVNDALRLDATLDYMKPKVFGQTECPLMIKSDAAHGLPFPSDCHYDLNSSATMWTALANAYVDIPVGDGPLKPYLGAGVGFAHVKYDDFDFQEVCPGCSASYTRYHANNEGVASTRLATALMAGVSYDVSDRITLDTSYRFLHVNGGDMYKYDAPDTANGASGVQARDNGFNMHQVRAGLRVNFN